MGASVMSDHLTVVGDEQANLGVVERAMIRRAALNSRVIATAGDCGCPPEYLAEVVVSAIFVRPERNRS
jgi:hypothetical protein